MTDEQYIERVKMRRACSYCRKSLGWHDLPLVRGNLYCLCDECYQKALERCDDVKEEPDSIFTLVTVLEANDPKKW